MISWYIYSILEEVSNLVAEYIHFPFSSSLIIKILKDAFNAGKKFRVIVVDSRPKNEGKAT